jgi:6-pyruvoyltetrahydropterin/6-carboxytetrahydropterin synthase
MELGEGGMLVDFGILKKALRTVIDTWLDHKDLNDIAEFKDDPSAERIAQFIYEKIHRSLPAIKLSAVDIYETPGTMARYVPEEML